MHNIKSIDFQVGDVIEPKDPRYSYIKSKVLDITEKGIIVEIIGVEDSRVTIRHHESNLMTKCIAGTILYGSKDKKYSAS